jgi:hypothetical protein
MAQVKAVHQLHCLFAIWKDHHIDHIEDALDQRNHVQDYYENHYEHCVDIIRQRLMCSADPGLVTSRWVEGEDKLTKPDVNTMHYCRNMDSLLDWNKKNAASVEVEKINWIAPTDAVRLAVPL